MATPMHLHIHHRPIRDPARCSVPFVYTTRQQGSPDFDLQRHVVIRTHHDPYLSRRLPRRLLVPKPYAYPQPIHTRRHFTEIYAAQLS